MYFASFSNFADAALLLPCLVIRLRQMSVDVLEPAKITAAFISILILGSLLVRVIRTSHTTVGPQRWDGPGKVLLFPCFMSHMRISPQKHSFSYSYLTVGVPVGFEGNAAGMVFVGSTNAGKKSNHTISVPKACFTINAGDHLERGGSELGLRGKLDAYLRSQGIESATYPHAYLVTAPRFLGCSFNPVSFWYLYSADHRLTAMILEVNNTCDERRMYFLRADCGGDDDKKQEEADSPPLRRASSGSRSQQQHHHIFKQTWPKDFHVSPFNPREGTYTLSATDPLQLEPSSTRGHGPAVAITITLYPPAHHANDHPPSTANTTANTTATPNSNTSDTTSPANNTNHLPLPILTASLTSLTPIDPCPMTPHQKLVFLLRWGWVVPLTLPRILLQASLLFFRRRLRVWTRPEPLPRPGTLCRRASEVERGLEGVVAGYVRWVVFGSGEGGRVGLRYMYMPAGVDGAGIGVGVGGKGGEVGGRGEGVRREGRKQRQRQRQEDGEGQGVVKSSRMGKRTERAGEAGGQVEGEGEEEELVFRVLTPAFYSRLVSYGACHGHESLLRELESGTIWVSRPDLLRKLVLGLEKKRRVRGDHNRGTEAAPAAAGWFESACYWLIPHLRRARPSWESSETSVKSRKRVQQPSALDAYVRAHEPADARRTYRNCVLKLLLADRIAFGLLPLLEMQLVLLRVCVAWCLPSVLEEVMKKGWAFRGAGHSVPDDMEG